LELCVALPPDPLEVGLAEAVIQPDRLGRGLVGLMLLDWDTVVLTEDVKLGEGDTEEQCEGVEDSFGEEVVVMVIRVEAV
jgi:hypothetical protein